MTSTRDFGAELDVIKQQLEQLQRFIQPRTTTLVQHLDNSQDEMGYLYYSGSFSKDQGNTLRWDPQQKDVAELLGLDAEKASKILGALGHKQRIDILRTLLVQPQTGAELVEGLQLGTTGQLYHHIKALLGADLLAQEERGGTYTVPRHRVLPVLLLLAAVSDLLDTSDYLDMTEARQQAGSYLGSASAEAHDPHYLLWSVVENSILEHQAGFCDEVTFFLHADGSVTVADNGRGIPVTALPGSEKTNVQAVLTELSVPYRSASYRAPGSEKGISIPVVNALSSKLTVEIRREGKVFRQDYKHGIPQSALLTVGTTKETGTGITFLPDRELFGTGFDTQRITEYVAETSASYPQLKIEVC